MPLRGNAGGRKGKTYECFGVSRTEGSKTDDQVATLGLSSGVRIAEMQKRRVLKKCGCRSGSRSGARAEGKGCRGGNVVSPWWIRLNLKRREETQPESRGLGSVLHALTGGLGVTPFRTRSPKGEGETAGSLFAIAHHLGEIFRGMGTEGVGPPCGPPAQGKQKRGGRV